MHRNRITSEAEDTCTLASPGVQVDELWPEVKKGADPIGDVINGELADTADSSDPGTDFLMKVVKRPAMWEALLHQHVSRAAKSVSRDTALMRVSLAIGPFGQRRRPNCVGQTGVTSPVAKFAIGERPTVTEIGADDFFQCSGKIRTNVPA